MNSPSSILLGHRIKELVVQFASVDKLAESFYRFLKKSFSSYEDLHSASEAYSNTTVFLNATIKGAEDLRSELESIVRDIDDVHFGAVSERNEHRPHSSESYYEKNATDRTPQTAYDRSTLTPIVQTLRSLTRFCYEVSATLKRFEASVRCQLECPNEATLETGASAICERLAGEVEKNRMRLEKMLMLLRSYAIEAEILTPPYPAGWTVVTDGNELEALKSENAELRARLAEAGSWQSDGPGSEDGQEELFRTGSPQGNGDSGDRSAFRAWLRSIN
ncbi:hypothetical protein W97_02533 [Coniosporium apollinis CBS 100218]|uniref:Uncharacterized protein n=1 Tax=Coniosporium apollinis (strain CBS 100218) TaxID=1168221 RepID=R7YNS0_CONA1|nr:uncharacterized protein W97_02533 [Coniosporium apollinis CBS 100218]EON63306.1 hypothetical protein W97_02533 [Coniosporium apollinis CBS 100218]